MPRKPEGTTLVSDGAIYASVIIAAPRKRLARALKGIVAVDDEPLARAWATTLQELVDVLRAAGRGAELVEKIDLALQVGRDDPAKGLERVRSGVSKLRAGRADASIAAERTTTGTTSFEKFAKRWTSGELHRLYPDHVAEKKTAEKDAGALKLHVYPVVGHVPLAEITLKHAQAVLRAVPLERSSAVRRQVAQLLVRVMNLAVYPCEILKASAPPEGLPPQGEGQARRISLPV